MYIYTPTYIGIVLGRLERLALVGWNDENASSQEIAVCKDALKLVGVLFCRVWIEHGRSEGHSCAVVDWTLLAGCHMHLSEYHSLFRTSLPST